MLLYYYSPIFGGQSDAGKKESKSRNQKSLKKMYVFSSPRIARLIPILIDKGMPANNLRQNEKRYQ